jgi:hypothetical protein
MNCAQQVNIGILNVNPSIAEGTIKILEKLWQVNINEFTELFFVSNTTSIAVCARVQRHSYSQRQARSVECVALAKLLRLADFGNARLSNWEPVPQEFHHSMLILKVRIIVVLLQ